MHLVKVVMVLILIGVDPLFRAVYANRTDCRPCHFKRRNESKRVEAEQQSNTQKKKNEITQSRDKIKKSSGLCIWPRLEIVEKFINWRFFGVALSLPRFLLLSKRIDKFEWCVAVFLSQYLNGFSPLPGVFLLLLLFCHSQMT